MLEESFSGHAQLLLHFLNISLDETGYSCSPCSLDFLTSPSDRFPEFGVLRVFFAVVLSGTPICIHHLEFRHFIPVPRYGELRSSYNGFVQVVAVEGSFSELVWTAAATSRLMSELSGRHCKSMCGFYYRSHPAVASEAVKESY